MDSKDPPPFGYTFNTDFFGSSDQTLTNAGPSLLSENENQSLVDFFAHTDPFLSETPLFAPDTDTKDPTEDFSWDFVPPPTIHSVSTTIPDQSHLQHNFHPEPSFNPNPLSQTHLVNTQDDLQAASTLFNNAQASHTNGNSYGMHSMGSSTTHPHNFGLHNVPMVSTSHGPMDEQLAALLPNHSENGSIDAQVAAQFSQVHHRHLSDMLHVERPQRPLLKRSYTYGTDNAFNANGFVVSSPNETEDAVTRRLLEDLRHAQPLTKTVIPIAEPIKPSSPPTKMKLPLGLGELPSDGDGQSDEESSENDDGEDRPAKKPRKSRNPIKVEKTTASVRKGMSGRAGKGRKASVDEPTGKKKRPSSAGQKPVRENLTEEQKRSNHILSEQKRRNLIKRGFDDLHELVPEISNGGLSKSSVLMEAAMFLEKLIEDNKALSQELAQSADG